MPAHEVCFGAHLAQNALEVQRALPTLFPVLRVGNSSVRHQLGKSVEELAWTGELWVKWRKTVRQTGGNQRN
jgi:hypothetical protein